MLTKAGWRWWWNRLPSWPQKMPAMGRARGGGPAAASAVLRGCRSGVWAVLLLAAVGSPMAATAAASEAGWQVGVARIGLTRAGGMVHDDSSVHDREADGESAAGWAKALTLRDQAGTTQVLVSLGALGIDRRAAEQFAAAIGERTGLPRQAIVLSCFKTFGIPKAADVRRPPAGAAGEAPLPLGTPDHPLQAAVIRLVDAAIASSRPAAVAWTVGRVDFAVNRVANAEPDVPALRAADRLAGPVDHDVPVLVVREPGLTGNAGVRAVVAGYACGAGDSWPADWPEYAQLALETHCPRATAFVWLGCGEDQAPLPRGGDERARQYGADLAAAVTAAVNRRVVPVAGELAAVWRSVPPRPTARQSPTVPVQTWRLGDGPHWVFLGGTPVVDVALRLKAELGCGKTWVAGWCNGSRATVSEPAIVPAVRQQVAATGGVAATAARTIRPRPYPDHADLAVAWDEAIGAVRPIATPADWERRRRDILQGMQAIMGRLPSPDELGPLEVSERGRDEVAGCTRLTLSYSVGDGQFAPADLYLPADGVGMHLLDSDGRRPAVLALHPTSPLGKRVVGGDGPRANRAYGLELAKRGYVVLAPDYPSFGELADYDFQLDHYASGTLAGIVNHRRGIDLLVARPEVDAARIGAIGHSLGGHNAIFIGAFDSRVKGVVSSCGWDPFHAYRGGRIGGWAQDVYMPWVREVAGCNPAHLPFDFPEAVAALAPRGFFSASPLADHNFSAAAVAAAEPAIRQVYERLGATDQFVLRQPDCGHDFPLATREEAYAFLDRVVAGRTTVK